MPKKWINRDKSFLSTLHSTVSTSKNKLNGFSNFLMSPSLSLSLLPFFVKEQDDSSREKKTNFLKQYSIL